MICLPFVPTQVTLRGNVGSLDSPMAAHLSTFTPRGQGIALRGSGMVSKNPQKIGEANGIPSLPTRLTQVTKTGNVGSLDAPWAAHLSTFGSRGQGNALRASGMVSKNQQKIEEANGMPSLPSVPTQVVLRGNVCFLDALRVYQLSTFGPRGQGIALRGT